MCKYIFPTDYIPKYLMTQCALTLSSSRWHCLIHNDDVMFHLLQLLYAVKYTFHCHLMVDVVNKQPVIKILILKLLKIIFLRIW